MSQAAAAPTPKKSLMPMLVAAVVAAALAGGGGWYYARQHAPDPDAAPAILPAQYHKLEPALVVNIDDAGSLRYLQAELQVMARDPKVFADLDAHAPAIRDALLSLFGRYPYADLMAPEGREKLRAEALEAIRAALPDAKAAASIEALYFTSFVMQ